MRDVLDYYSAAPERLSGRQIPVPGGIDITFHEPMGVVGVIVPWNFPMPLAAWGFAPALAAGNTVIVKPAEYTPLTALRLEELALEAGLPEDVLQVAPGTGAEAGEHLVRHPLVRKIVFTGSTAVGKRIMRLCADQVKPLTLELGGKNANIVFSGRSGCHPAGQRHRVWTVRIAVDARPRAGHAGHPRPGQREPVGELALIGAVLDALRGYGTVRQIVISRTRERALVLS